MDFHDLSDLDQRICLRMYKAATEGDVAAIQVLFEVGCDINQKNQSGMTPLMLAAKNNHAEMVDWLIKRGANQRFVDFVGRTAKDYARKAGECHSLLRNSSLER